MTYQVMYLKYGMTYKVCYITRLISLAFSDSFENDDAPGHFTYELSKKITVGLEAYNAAIALCVIVEDSNKTTKSRIAKQLKQIRKFLVKKQSICTESQKAVTLRLLPSNSIRKLEVVLIISLTHVSLGFLSHNRVYSKGMGKHNLRTFSTSRRSHFNAKIIF